MHQLARILARSIERHSLMREVRDLRAKLAAAGVAMGGGARAGSPDVLTDFDRLTGLYTRQALLRVMSAMVQQRQAATIVMIDVRDLRQINEEFGDDAGDRVLTELAGLIRRRLGPTDAGGRYDGDCLVVVMPEDEIRAMDILREIREGLHDLARERILPTTVELRAVQRSTPLPTAAALQEVEFNLR